MPNTQLTGGMAVGLGVVVWLTHGGDWTPEQIGALSAGLGAAITYTVRMAERLLGFARNPEPAIEEETEQ